MKITKAITIAKKAALNSNAKFRVGAVLFFNDTYVFGFNRNFNVKHVNRQKPFSIHAEEMCIIKANRIMNFDFENSTLVIVRINKKSDLLLCTPCKYCQGMIHKFGIGTIYFSV